MPTNQDRRISPNASAQHVAPRRELADAAERRCDARELIISEIQRIEHSQRQWYSGQPIHAQVELLKPLKQAELGGHAGQSIASQA